MRVVQLLCAAVVLCGTPALGAKQLMVMSAPLSSGYYSALYGKILDFQARYALAIIGHDDVLILTDATARAELMNRGVPAAVLVENALQQDIWMRDFTTVNPYSPVQFRYAPAAQGGSRTEADHVQNKFNDLLSTRVQVGFAAKQNYVLDGGNVVDNHANRAITTDRFLADNPSLTTKAAAKEVLKQILKVDEVAIIPSDDPNLAHADGMVMWAGDSALVVNDYSDQPTLRASIMAELRASFPSVTITEVPVQYKEDAFDSRFSSATGINVNSVMTEDYIYMPTFNSANDAVVRGKIAAITSKQIIGVDARDVAVMGGSCRCLVWQLGGTHAATAKRGLAPSALSSPATPTPGAGGVVRVSLVWVVVAALVSVLLL